MFTKALLLLALSITILSIPTTKESLNKRETYGWIGSYDDDDTYCQNGVKGICPKMETACVTFDPTTQRIGGSFGSGILTLSSFSYYSDPSCKNLISTVTPEDGKPGFCMTLDDAVQSVQGDFRV